MKTLNISKLINHKILEFAHRQDALNFADDNDIKHSGVKKIKDSYYLKKPKK